MSKNFLKDGKWTENPNPTAVLVCSCGNKYIKTREGQGVCVRCLVKVESK